MDYFVRAKKLQEYMVACRRRLHQYPELHCELPNTIRFVAEQLEKEGIAYEFVEQGGIVALLNEESPGSTFLLRADMDALPIQELSGESFSSTNENMHACGHDMHTTMLLGAAKLLNEKKAELNGKIKLAFQVDEEGSTGMRTLIKSGLLENPKVDAAMALHVLPGNMNVGQYFCKPGCICAGMATFHIEIKGKGVHGATPYKGVDPINVASHICVCLQEIIAREVPATELVVVTNGYLKSGNVPNVIPTDACLGGTIRSCGPEREEMVKKRIVEISKAIATAFDAECEVVFPAMTPACINNPSMVAIAKRCAASIGLCEEDRETLTVSEDFGMVMLKVPSVFVWIGAGGSEEKYVNGVLHGASTCFNEEVLPYGAALLATTADTWLRESAVSRSNP